MSNFVRNVAILALVTTEAGASKLVQKSVMTLEDNQPSPSGAVAQKNSLDKLDVKGLIAQNYAAADAMELEDQPAAPQPGTTVMAQQKAPKQSWAQDFADEFEQEENDAGVPHEIKRFTMAEIHDLSLHADLSAGKSQPQPESAPSQPLAKPTKQVLPTVPAAAPEEKQAPIQQQQNKLTQELSTAHTAEDQVTKDLPQSGSPISDTIVDGLRAASGKGADQQNAQPTQAQLPSKEQQEQLDGTAVDYLKFAENKAESYGSELNQSTLKSSAVTPQQKAQDQPKNPEVKKEEPKKEEPKKEQVPQQQELPKDQGQQVQTQVVAAAPPTPPTVPAPVSTSPMPQPPAQPANMQQVPPKVAAEQEQKNKNQDEIKRLITEQENDDDQAIQKAAATVKTDEEQLEALMKDIKSDQSQEQKDIRKEMSQLKAGEFDSLFTSGAAAIPEVREQELLVVKPAPTVPALTKVAQNLVTDAKSKTLNIEDLKSAQAQIQVMINTIEKGNGKK